MSHRPEPFLIISLARCGSTSLAQIINLLQPGICVFEPFNPKKYNGHYWRLAINRGLEPALAEILRTRNCIGIKHVCHLSGWPFGEKTSYNDDLMTWPGYKVIFLTRRNLLRRIVSQLVAEESGLWAVDNADKQESRRSHLFQSVDAARITKFIEQDRKFYIESMQRLSDASTSFIRIDFEDLYESKSRIDRISVLNTIISFIGFRATFRDPLPPTVEELLFGRERFSSSELYDRLPGILDIHRNLSSDSNGYILG